MGVPLIIANVEYVNAVPFAVVVVYEDGNRVDEIVVNFTSYDDIIQLISSEMYLSHDSRFEVWTSSVELYGECLKIPGVAARIKHPTDTLDTERIIVRDRDILIDLYEIEPLPVLSKWRAKAFYYSSKLTLKLGGIN